LTKGHEKKVSLIMTTAKQSPIASRTLNGAIATPVSSRYRTVKPPIKKHYD